MKASRGARAGLPVWVIKYTDGGPASGCPDFTQRVRAYDREHAELLFLEAPDAEGWEILSITREPRR